MAWFALVWCGFFFMKRLTIRAAINTFTGYGQIACEIFAGLEQRGVFCPIRSCTGDKDEAFGAKVPLEMKSRFVHCPQPEPWELLIRSPWELPTPGMRTVFMTMWESTVLPKEYVTILNKAHRIIVPSDWNKEGFEASGVTVPISVIPLGISPEIFNYVPPRPEDGRFIIGIAGRVSHGANRKGIRRAIDLFLKAFPDQKDVELHVKVHPDCDIGKVDDPRIKVTREHLPWHKVRKWLADLDVFLSLARVEGFGLWQLQALACGRPVIAAPYAGMEQFVNSENSFCLPFMQVHNEDYGGGMWAEISDSAVTHGILDAYLNHGAVFRKGVIAAETATNFSWNHTVEMLYRQLGEDGAWD